MLRKLFPRRPRVNLRDGNGASSVIEPEDRLGTLEDVAGEGSSPIVSVSVGTTGLNRSKMYHRHMDALGVANRIQSMLIYDCNQFNINQLKEDAARARIADKIVLPEYLPFSEGFLRRVDQYEKHYGAIERDMENMVEKMEHLSLSAGTEPQIILEWIGFGGHAMLSYMFHDIVAKRFPEARILPIVCFPDDRGMHKNIREHGIWDQTVEVFGSDATLITDNRIATDYRRLDESLITALSAVEGCFAYEPSSGSLAEVISVFNITGNRWVTVENTEIPVLNRKALSRRAGRHSDENHKKALSKLAQKVKDRVFEIAQPENRFPKSAFFYPGTRENEQRIYVTLPLLGDEVQAIRDDLEDQLKREEFNKAFPGTQIAYAAGNPQTRTPENWEYVHVIKFAGLDIEPTPLSISSILDDVTIPDQFRGTGHRSVKTRGQIIIDVHHLNGASSATPDEPSPDAAESETGWNDRDTEQKDTGRFDPAEPNVSTEASADDADIESDRNGAAEELASATGEEDGIVATNTASSDGSPPSQYGGPPSQSGV